MKLFFAPAACSLAPHIALCEAGVDVALEKVDLRAKKTASGDDYLAINPKGYVPALQLDDGDVLTEVSALVQYVADLNPSANLAPAAGTRARVKLQEWLGFISSEVHKQFSPLFNPAATDEQKAAHRAQIARRLGYVNTALSGQDYLLGAGFSVADAYLFTVLNWSGWVGVDLSGFPAIQAWQARVGARPGVVKALKEEGLA